MPIPNAQPEPSGIPPAPAATLAPPPPPPATTTAAAPLGPEEFQPLAALAAIAFPGLGHFVLGEKRRAALIAAGVLGLFTSGALIGGIDAIDRKENPVWFVGQALTGPLAFIVDGYHQSLKVLAPPLGAPANAPASWRSPAPNERRGADGAAVIITPDEAARGVKPPYSKSLSRSNDMGMLFAALAGMVNLIAITDAALHGRRNR